MISQFDGEPVPLEIVPLIQDAFSPAGILSKSPDFEFRPQQQQMAMAVAHALETEGALVAEAGTGVGKSLAYLVPALRFALDKGRKAIVSTHTINLQEQLIHKDIPIVRKIWNEDFPAALLKGRQNYLCRGRLLRAMQQTADLFTQGEVAELRKIFEWSQFTQDGTLSDLKFPVNPKVWAQVCSEPHVCTPRICGPGSGCFYQDARRKVNEAKVVVLNHTLFFGLLAQGGSMNENEQEDGFLFPTDFVILDEAHTIENIAAQQLGIKVSQFDLTYELRRLFNPRTRKGILVTGGNAGAIQTTIEAQDAVDVFFDHVRESVDFDNKGNVVRVREPQLVQNILAEPLVALAQSLIALADDTDNEITKAERRDAARRVMDYHAATERFLTQEEEKTVYWTERMGAEGKNVVLNAAPIEVADKLRSLLFHRNRAAILTSATLSTGENKMSYFVRRTGAESATTLQVGSPFDFKKQMKIIVARSMPDPTEDNYKEKLAEWIRYSLEESDGHAFVLFTSYRLMQEMGTLLRDFCESQNWTFLIQGGEMKRAEMLDNFKKCDNGVLFGTDSFWTGVDVPGQALTHVIITRLPFDVPNHPLVQSRIEAIEQRGGRPFVEYSIPEAILKMKQGIGRLIRTKKDCGIVTILDSRISNKFYGKAFLQALPDAHIEFI